VLVTTSVRAPSSADEKRTLVRIARIASAKPGGTPVLINGSSPFQDPSAIAGTMPSGDKPRWARISSGVLIRLSRYSKKNARLTASKLPPRNASVRFRTVRGEAGRRGRSAASTTRMLLVFSSLLTPVSLVRCSRLS
jgi:hypothetical protein